MCIYFTDLNQTIAIRGMDPGLYLNFVTDGYTGIIDQMVLQMKGLI